MTGILVEASALPASAGLTRARLGLGAPLLRLRPDEQLVSLFRAGNEDAFRVIHDRYRARMLAYARQMLASSSADPEDAVQEIFVRAYAGLRANRRDLALRAWLYRIAHNRCVDELRRPRPLAVEAVEDLREAPGPDPHARVEQREALRRLIVDVQHLPEQQRSALLMRELGGMPYAQLAGALGVSVPAVKSLLVRARVGLAQASEARDTACASIREDLVVAHDRGVRASGRARRHMRDCTDCRRFRTEVQGMSRHLGLLVPALGPLAVAAKLIGLGGIGGGGGAAAGSGTGAAAGATATAAGATATAAGATGTAAVGGGAVAGATGTAAVTGGTAAAAGGTVAVTATAVSAGASTGALATAGAAAGTAHVATLLAATAIAAGGAIGIQHEVSATHRPVRARHAAALAALPRTGAAPAARATTAPTKATAPAAAPATSAATVAGATDASRIRVPNATATTTPPATTTTTAATGGSPAGENSTGVTALASSSGVPAASTGATTTAPTTTDPTSTTPGATPPATDPTTTLQTPADPTSTDPTSTAPATTPADPTATTVAPAATSTPIAGATTGGDPVTASTPATTTGGRGANPGTATGIVPTVSSATTWAATGRSWRRIRLQTWRDVPRGVAAGGTTIER